MKEARLAPGFFKSEKLVVVAQCEGDSELGVVAVQRASADARDVVFDRDRLQGNSIAQLVTGSGPGLEADAVIHVPER